MARTLIIQFMKTRTFCIILACLVWLPQSARASSLIADLSNHLVAITTAFSGDDVLLFGALDTEGRDVAVVVRGPSEAVTVRRKSQIGPIWLNTDQRSFVSAPSFYAVAASAPLLELTDQATLARHGIGAENLDIRLSSTEDIEAEEAEAYRAALLRNMRAADLYSREPGQVRFLGGRLFRTNLSFPANVPPGNYNVEVFEFDEGQVIGAQRNILIVSKVGAEAELFDLARGNPALYGLISILIAISAGWTASALFKRS